MKEIGLINGIVISGGAIYRNKVIVVAGKRIENVIDESSLTPDIELVDLKGCYITPGLIDLQTNGAGGALFGGVPTPDGLAVMEKTLMAEGTTGFLANAPTNDLSVYYKMIQYAVKYRPKALGNYLGLHLEGPYINLLSKGAHPASLIRTATVGELKVLVEMAKGEIKIITLAPEVQPSEVIRYLDNQGVVVSIGHSAASYEQAMDFFNGRKRMVTHLFNGMQPMHHRSPGLVPAVFHARPYTGIVVDGIHVSYPMVNLAKQIMGQSLLLVTDSATECHEGVYQYTLKNDRYVTVGADGNEVLASSALTMLKAVQNSVEGADIPLAEAINMATLYPAQVLSIADHIGLIKRHYDANFAIFDRNFKIQHVYFEGEKML